MIRVEGREAGLAGKWPRQMDLEGGTGDKSDILWEEGSVCKAWRHESWCVQAEIIVGR